MSEDDKITLSDGTVLRKKNIVSIEAKEFIGSERAYVRICLDCREPVKLEGFRIDDAEEYKARIVKEVFDD